MPYETLKELPASIRQALPKPAQEIYQAAFNSAWDQYQDDEDRRGSASREEVANKVAWAAVKQQYVKQGQTWQRKQ